MRCSLSATTSAPRVDQCSKLRSSGRRNLRDLSSAHANHAAQDTDAQQPRFTAPRPKPDAHTTPASPSATTPSDPSPIAPRTLDVRERGASFISHATTSRPPPRSRPRRFAGFAATHRPRTQPTHKIRGSASPRGGARIPSSRLKTRHLIGSVLAFTRVGISHISDQLRHISVNIEKQSCLSRVRSV